MIRGHVLAIAISSMVLVPSLTRAGDLSTYREFQLGMKLPAIVKLVGMNASDARVVHQRPALIQELDWQPSRYPGSLSDADSVKDIVFTFSNEELFRMVVNYDRYKTEGLTDQDMTDGISAKYGTASRPGSEITFRSLDNDTAKVIARWEDPDYSFDLVRSSYQPVFAMVIYSKRLDAAARTAITESLRIEEQEAPQREAEHQKKQEEAYRVKEEKARLANKASFRP